MYLRCLLPFPSSRKTRKEIEGDEIFTDFEYRKFWYMFLSFDVNCEYCNENTMYECFNINNVVNKSCFYAVVIFSTGWWRTDHIVLSLRSFLKLESWHHPEFWFFWFHSTFNINSSNGISKYLCHRWSSTKRVGSCRSLIESNQRSAHTRHF